MANSLVKAGRRVQRGPAPDGSIAAEMQALRLAVAGGRPRSTCSRGRTSPTSTSRCTATTSRVATTSDRPVDARWTSSRHPRPAGLRRRFARERGRRLEAFAAVLLTINLRHKGRGQPAASKGSEPRRTPMTIKIYDTAQRAVVPFEAGPVVQDVRVRHHALRLDAPGPRRDLPHLRPPDPPPRGARVTRCAWCATSPTSTTRSCRRPASSACPTSSSPKPSWPASAPTWRRSACRPPIAEPRATEAIDGIIRHGQPAARRRSRVPHSRHRLLRRVDASRASVSCRTTRADQMVRLARTRGGNPDDPHRRDPLDFVLWQPSRARRARVARAVRRRSSRVARRVLGDGDARARAHARPARRRYRPHLPAPRMRGRAERGHDRPAVRRATGCTRRW